MKVFSPKTGLLCLLLVFQAPLLFAFNLTDFEVPDKDTARISRLPRKVMSSGELNSYLAGITGKVESALSADDKKMAAAMITKAGTSKGVLAAMANAMWLNANYDSAVMLMGRACLQDPNPDNLNNYAAFLTMVGGEQLALPILQKLNQDFPNNSTVLNNLGQAWFGLGDLATAKPFLDSAARIYAYHPQANVTKAVIENRNGNKAAAIESLKRSIKKGYSPSKEAMLAELGYKVSGKDLHHEMHVSEGALGFDKWMEIVPKFPKNLGELSVQKGQWEAFYRQVDQASKELNAKNNRAVQQLREETFNSKKSGRRDVRFNLSPKMRHVVKYYQDNNSGSRSTTSAENPEFLVEMMNQAAVPIKAYTVEGMAIDKKFAGSPRGADCDARKASANKYIQDINTLFENGFKQHMAVVIRRLKNEAYGVQFSTSDQHSLEVASNQIKLDFFNHLLIVRPYIDSPSTQFNEASGSCPVVMQVPKPRKLPDFDDLHCDSKVSFSVPFAGSYTFTCNQVKVTLAPFMGPFEAQFTKNTNTGEYLTASAGISVGPVKVKGAADLEKGTGKVEAGFSQDIGKGALGPVPLEASASATIGVEIDEGGISDVIISAAVEGKAGNDAGSVSVDTSARYGINSGPSRESNSSIGGAIGQF